MKYLECPDLHFDTKWIDTMDTVFTAIEKAAQEQEVDFIALPGDLYNRPVYASDQGGINKLRGYIRRLTKICPVVAVYGTPSHEAPGSLEPLVDVGLIILQPGKMYGYRKNSGDCDVYDLASYPSKPTDYPSAILFGVPELSKKNIQSQLQLPAEQANAEAVNLFKNYITEFVAPMRMKHKDVPAIMLMHGNVSDSKRDNETDVILKASDIVIHTEDLEIANLDRVSLGHIHTPWESEKISAGYAGSWGTSWGEVGFNPGMNLVEITGYKTGGTTRISGNDNMIQNIEHLPSKFGSTITRIPYGTPERRKILKPLSQYDPDIAYWLHTKNEHDILPDNVHPWSRTTYDVERQETRRVSKEDAEKIKSLKELFKIADANVKKSALDKVDTIQENIEQESHKKIDLQLLCVEISGCTFFNESAVSLDMKSNAAEGITAIRGNNGSGKSSLLSFCTPYPLCVGKDTDSGRDSAIKDFFTARDSYIKKSFDVNGQQHNHLITIKAAHTKSAKVECYLDIEGMPQLDKGSFDEMFSKCEELYGPYSDYLLTTFYVQPLQGKTKAGLMDAGITEIRDLVHNIAGKDRDREKRFTLDKAQETQKEIDRLNSWLDGAEEFQEDPDMVKQRIKEFETLQIEVKKDLATLKAEGENAAEEHEKNIEILRASQAEEERKRKNTYRIYEISSAVENKKRDLDNYKMAIAELSQAKAKIKEDDANRAKNRDIEDAISRNDALRREYENKASEEILYIKEKNQEIQQEYVNQKNELKRDIARYESIIETHKREVASLNKPCENCGYLPTNVEKQIKELQSKIEKENKNLFESKDVLADLNEPDILPEVATTIEPIYEPVEEKCDVLSCSERENLEAVIQKGNEAAARIPVIEESIAELEEESDNLAFETYNIIEGIEDKVAILKQVAETKRNEWQEKHDKLLTTESQINSCRIELEKIEEVKSKIKQTKKDIKTQEKHFEDWQYIAKMLQPSKIPALELEFVLDVIDNEATKIIQPFEQERYSFYTATQKEGKSGTVDKFDIKIHDNVTGKDLSFTKWNPGHKAFFADAYTKALILQRNDRLNRRYDPVIMDESDGPIQPERIADYYEMQKRYWNDTHVLVVSHSPSSHEYVENNIYMEELKK